MSAPQSPFVPFPSQVDLPDLERNVIAWWRENRVFERSLAGTADGPRWVFYEGPPTANGTPGTHHVEARVFKDVFPRFKTMKGFSVPRRAGWDCHGLPVELAVESELGLSGKPDIERLGIAEFNARCRDSVQRYVGEFEEVTERMGHWVDLTDPYWTMSPTYVDSVWWALKRIHDAGLLSEDYRVAPYCPRDGTTLSDHEVAQGYETVHDPSVTVRLPAIGPVAGWENAEFLVWTTTPWTLVANTAVAVHPDVEYVLARTPWGRFVVAANLAERLLTTSGTDRSAGPGDGLDHDFEVLARFPGSELAGIGYRRPFDLVDVPAAHRVVLARYVSTAEGTGLVHQAPAFGADDLATCRDNGLPVVNPIGTDGRFLDEVPRVGGEFFKDADATLIDDLARSGRLFTRTTYEHPYPHCWRCHTPLMYYAQLSWYIRTARVRAALWRENERTNWYPEHVKHGRFGDWLAGNVDWSLSRSRYWGTPLPLWRCVNLHVTAVGSRAELAELAGRDLGELDPHRPHIDEITFACPECGERAERVPEVIDAWFDSGAMPFAQFGYPHVPGSVAEFERSYPAQYICEAIDQTRGWFYTLMAVGTLVFDRSAYENVVCLGHILAEDGRKMSKHLGNVLEPIPLMDAHGADAVRWFMLCSGSPWVARRVGHSAVAEIARKVLLTYWNTASFFARYASLAGWQPERAAALADRPVLDRWVLAAVHRLAGTVDERLENYDTVGAGRELAEFLDDLSNWYVRRSRQRFWDGDIDAIVTLHHCLDVLTRLLAPFVPFITERVWSGSVLPGQADGPESVHLASWPLPDPSVRDAELLDRVALARRLVETGRAARKTSGIRVRQPLGRAFFGLPAGTELPAELLEEVAAELNVRRLEPLDRSEFAVLDVAVKPNFRALGGRFGKRTQRVADAIAAADPVALAGDLAHSGSTRLEVDGDPVSVHADEVLVREVPRSGWQVESDRDITIALDVEITPELHRAGLAREVIRFVQEARKREDLDVADRIELRWSAEGELRAAVLEHTGEIATAVLAPRILEAAGDAPEGFGAHADTGLGLRAWIRRVPDSSDEATD